MRLIKSRIYSCSITLCFCVFFFLTGYHYLNLANCYPKTLNRSQIYLETILDMTRLNIKCETWDYNFTYSGVDKLEDLIIESGGTPVRSLIVSTWRSGSSFFGDLLNAMHGNFYHYEPMIEYESKQLREQQDINKAIQRLKNLFKCNHTYMEDNLKYGKNVMKYGYFTFNTRLWDVCQYKKELCVDANFTASFCKLFPFQNMKVVRLRLRFIESILEDEEIKVKVVLLIRDPRGVMESRSKVKFCTDPDCIDPASLCTDMISDYVAASQFVQKYPDRIMVLRFEDLVLNLNATTQQLLEFLRLAPNQYIDEFISTHTNVNAGDAYSTFRVSHDVAFKWKTVSNFSDVDKVQEMCKEAMNLWGYQRADSAQHMKTEEFYPLKPYSLYS